MGLDSQEDGEPFAADSRRALPARSIASVGQAVKDRVRAREVRRERDVMDIADTEQGADVRFVGLSL